jgi:hypothetical protein
MRCEGPIAARLGELCGPRAVWAGQHGKRDEPQFRGGPLMSVSAHKQDDLPAVARPYRVIVILHARTNESGSYKRL